MPEAKTELASAPPHVIQRLVEEAMVALLKGVRDVGMRAALSMSPLNPARSNYLASDWNRAITGFLDACDALSRIVHEMQGEG